jgi:hypothetical protein
MSDNTFITLSDGYRQREQDKKDSGKDETAKTLPESAGELTPLDLFRLAYAYRGNGE